MNTTENNKLIAEFMGLEIIYRPYSNGFVELSETELCDVDDLKYHTSWDWLMPVVEKAFCVACNKDMEGIMGADNHRQNIIDEHLMFNKIGTYEAVVEFIKWYNENKED